MKINLQFKIIGIVVLISLIFFSSLGYIDTKQHSQILEESYIEKAESIARVLDASIKDKGDLEDKSKLLSNIHKNIWLDPDILRISISLPYQDSLITTVSNEQYMIGELRDEDNLKSYRDNILISKFVVSKELGTKVLRVITPVHAGGQIVGTHQIDLTLEDIENRIKKEIVRTALIIILVMFITIVLMYMLLRFIIVKPISEMEKGVKSIAKGNLNYKVDVKSKDEIGELAQTFDEMRLGLRDRNQLLNSLLTTFKGKFGNIATILVRKNMQELVNKNPRIEKILPKSLGISIIKAKKFQREREQEKK